MHNSQHSRSRSARTPSTRSSWLPPRRVTPLVAAIMLAIGGSAPTASATPVSVQLTPTNGQTNQAVLTVRIFSSLTATSLVESTSTLDIDYDLATHELTLTAASLDGTDVHYGFGIGPVDGKNINVSLAAASTPVAVDPVTGAFSGLSVDVLVAADLYYNNSLIQSGTTFTTLNNLTGKLTVDPFGHVAGTNIVGTIPETGYPIPPLPGSVYLSGTLTLNFTGSLPGVVFLDGFDDGNFTEWSSHVP